MRKNLLLVVFGLLLFLPANSWANKNSGAIENGYDITQQFVEDLVVEVESHGAYQVFEKYYFSHNELVKIKDHIKFLLHNEAVFRTDIGSQASRRHIYTIYMIIQELMGELIYGKILNVEFIKESGCYDYFLTAAENSEEDTNDLCANDSRVDGYYIVKLADGTRKSFYAYYAYMIFDPMIDGPMLAGTPLTLYFAPLKGFDAFHGYEENTSSTGDNGSWVLIKIWNTENIK